MTPLFLPAPLTEPPAEDGQAIATVVASRAAECSTSAVSDAMSSEVTRSMPSQPLAESDSHGGAEWHSPFVARCLSDAEDHNFQSRVVVDTGEIYSLSKSSEEFCRTLQALTSAQKYCLLTNHKKPREDHVFPKTYIGGCKRNDIDTSFSLIYTQSITMAEKVGTAVGMPHITTRQQHRNNAETNSVQEYFKRSIAIPLLDHIIMCIDQQFSPSAVIAISLLDLVPSILCSKDVSLETANTKLICHHPSYCRWSLNAGRLGTWQCRLTSGRNHQQRQ